ncbi:sugar ABC transporter ATP-binding protein [Acidithiobacillus thiooxidans]|uniref:Sugar ABC transporter ATP-binding protein n=1 Tax=Acidithiobacillus thiooxidans TaxID=930 RepID=A0A1C2I3C9_ACITH|nr:ABC transporter ATP-binding protein [Acidithiobacillus thiooxidans]OCX70443.1 sugar ABC transporter ATP-binding protein [Acidithiobacillus thiooxidans]OCX79939.1 sugar ABC transporter ATP-binding protein [Acidithiobacillus thiooxidans]OCX82628.1 sugar ABC transporter ATP-binding protein [Acidithiobacillus thiooxidans]OCX86715.1 sugar ABC transporter ATP-binding protein [Acidithiobacillus thiooxidans]OFC50881.1 sugar ABC transporter ATP-binding protein [Acidithiobacillus thiooxidans]
MGRLILKDIHKKFGKDEVLHGINIETEENQFLILVGPSGCGKTTLLNIIAGLEQESAGDILINDRRVNDLSPKNRDIAMVFQSYALYPSMSVRDNILFGLVNRHVPKNEREQILQDVAHMLQLDHLLDRRPRQLSGGQQQRVAIGRAIARRPALFLFDEPLSNLDAKLRVEMRTEIKRLHQQLKTTMVYVTHDQIEAMTMGDLIAVMNDGIIQQLGTPDAIYNDPANRFVAGFMGSPSMNFIPVTVCQGDGTVWLELRGEGQSASRLPLPPVLQSGLKSAVDRQVILGIRPEQITDPGSAREGSALHTMELMVEMTEPTGADTLVFTRLNKTPIVARAHPSTKLVQGTNTLLSFHMERAVFFDPDDGRRLA